MPVFGADPSVEEREFPEFRPTVYSPKPVRSLVDYFAYHKQMKMNQRFNEQDRLIMSRYFSRALKQGFQDDTLRSMVDRFWQTWGGDTQVPALTFVSNDMQDKLQDTHKAHPLDAIYRWMIGGMGNDAPFRRTDAHEARRAVLKGARSLDLRYPDVVADILDQERGYEWTVGALRYVSDLVDWNLGEIESQPDGREYSWYIDLPPELASNRRSPSKIRPKRSSINRAITTIPIRKKHEQL